jgi:two-component system, LytTR family, response regulator
MLPCCKPEFHSKQMNNIKILLVDDNEVVRTTLKTLIVASGNYDIEEAIGVADGLKKYLSFNPNIIILDIEMGDGTGFDFLQQCPNHNFQLIFSTAFNHFAIKAFKYSAIDYLLKPVDAIELKNSLQKAITNINNQSFQKQLEIMLQQLSATTNSSKQIVLKDIDKTYFINIKDIIYCLAEGAYTKFYIANSEPILVSHNLRSYEELLEPAGFIRTHHSCLVNPQHIKIYDRKTDGGILILENGYTVPVSQRKKDFITLLLEKRTH